MYKIKIRARREEIMRCFKQHIDYCLCKNHIVKYSEGK